LHVKENDFTAQVTVVPLALSNNAGEIEMHCTSDIEGGSSSGGFISGASTYWTDYRVYEQKAGFMSIRVQTVALDNFVLASKECIEPALMKIDVEGAEHLVVQGARKTIEKHRPIILLELHSINCAYEVVSMLKDMRYDIKPLEINKVDGRIFIGCKPLQNISSINE
jgi:FkbM family methyltransferase